MAEVLATEVEQQLRRGLERDYLEFRDDSKYIRGRVDFQETVKRVLSRRNEAHVITEELSADILGNQIIKATLRGLLHFSALTSTNRDRVAGLYQALRAVSDTRISAGSFYRVRLHSNNRGYRLLLNICELVYRYALPDEAGTGMCFVGFARDDARMWKVFQLFVTNFYRRRQTIYTVNPEAFPWYSSTAHHSAAVFLPRLETDIVLSNSQKKIVIDTKYSIEPFTIRHAKTTLKPSHVNQMFAYMQNVKARDHKCRPVQGILLYAGVSGAFW